MKGLARGRLAKSIHDAGWSSFLDMLAYKAQRYGRQFQQTGRAFPSSQRCSNPACHRIDGPKPLKVRTWTCPGCGTVHDRDTNAARNTLQEGQRLRTTVAEGRAETENACGAPVRPGATVPAQRSETGSHGTLHVSYAV